MDELTALRVEVANFTGRVSEWMETTQQYRKELCAKNEMIRTELKDYKTEVKDEVKFVHKALAGLPCKERIVENKEKFRSVDKTFNYLKIAIGFATTLIVGHLTWR